MSKSKTQLCLLIASCTLAAAILLILVLFFQGIVRFNEPGSKYPVKGVDISAHQGQADWPLLASQGISFAFIKATEGSSYTDPQYAANIKGALSAGLAAGAYHFFSFESPFSTQLEHFHAVAGDLSGMLPPVVDVEFYGSFRSARDIDAAAVKRELRGFVDGLRRIYNKTPVIYTTQAAKNSILGSDFDDCDLWIRSVYLPVSPTENWRFWQYNDRARLKGYNGRERFIDMNVFNGSREEFYEYLSR